MKGVACHGLRVFWWGWHVLNSTARQPEMRLILDPGLPITP